MVLRRWIALHDGSRLVRWPLKCAAFAAVLVLVLYPRLWLLPTALERLGHLEGLITPQAEGLAPLEAEVRGGLPAEAAAGDVLARVEAVVERALPYRFDWDNYGVMFYIPTVAEALARGSEDCDGRAVVAASLLRRMGYESRLVSDYLHMWVVTPEGETMSPSVGATSIDSGGAGRPASRFRVSADTLVSLARGACFGVAVFPLARLAIVLVAFAALALHPRSRPGAVLIGAALLVAALALLRGTGRGLTEQPAGPVLGVCGAAVLLLGAGWWLIARERRPAAAAADR